MKNIYKLLSVVLMGLAFASCQKDELAIYHPDQKTSGQLEAIGSDYTLSIENQGAAFETFKFGATDYKIACAVQYALYADLDESFSKEKKLGTTSNAAAGIAVTTKAMNNQLISWNCAPGEPAKVYFRVKSNMMGEKNIIEGTETISNVISTNITPYLAEKEYAKVYVLGSFCEWKHQTAQFLYNYSEDGDNYRGVIDFGADPSENQFKITGADSWSNDTGNWGVADASTPAEAAEMKLLNGSNDNITQYTANRYYMFEFNQPSLVLYKLASFDNVSIIGAFNNWGDDDPEMEYNAFKGRFWIDYTFDTATELKFRANHSWDTNWGSSDGEKLAAGGANIPVEAGSYRIYLQLAQGTFTLDANMFGKEEPTSADEPEPEPEPYQGWGLIGVGGDWENDIEMAEDAGVWSCYVNLLATDAFKVRKDAGWDENRGAEGEVEPFVVTLDTPITATPGGKNLAVAADGFYKVVYNSNDETITISNGEVWSLIGAFNDWSDDVDMVLTDGKWVSPATQISGEFKIRHNHDWADNRGGVMEEVGVAFAATGDPNIVVEDGLWKVTYDPAAETILVEAGKPEKLWSIIGQVAGTSWDTDFYMTEQSNGTWVYEGLTIAEGDAFKIRFNNDWSINRGATGTEEPYAMTVGTAIDVVNNGKNLTGPAGTYNLTYNPADETMTLAEQDKGWGICGAYNGWGADGLDMQLVEMYPGIFMTEKPVTIAGPWKIRYNNSWDVNFGGSSLVEQGRFIQAIGGGDNLSLDGTYTVVYNANNGTIGTILWSVIGSIASAGVSWDKDIPMNYTSDGTYVSLPIALTTEDEIKLRKDCEWTENRGAAESQSTVTVAANTPIAVSNNGGNLKVTEDGVYVVAYNPSTEEISLTTSCVGIIGEFNDWSGDDFMFYGGEGKFYAFNCHYLGPWKLRMGGNWTVNRGASGEMDPTDISAIAWEKDLTVVQDGKNFRIMDEGISAAGFNIVYDAIFETISINQRFVF